jgi:hypothetical protein
MWRPSAPVSAGDGTITAEARLGYTLAGMRRARLLFGFGVFALGTLAPSLEVLAPCVAPCVDEGAAGDCAAERCCSCCVHSRLLAPQHVDGPSPLSPSSRFRTAGAPFAASADPREILHVPKPTFG